MGHDYENRHCGFCSLPHPVFVRKGLGVRHLLWSAVLSACLTWLMWQRPDARGFVFFAAWIFVAEVTIVIRRILSLPCPHCGFDPVLYYKNRPKALEKIIQTLDRRKDDPDVWFSRKPAIHLPYRKVKPAPASPPEPEKVA